MISSIPKKALRNLVILTGVLAIVVGVLVVPSYFAIGKAEANRIKIDTQLKEQRQLAPVFGQLVKKRQALKASSADLPVRVALAREDAGDVGDALTRLAVSNRMQMVGINLDLNAMVNEVRLMQVDMVIRGKLADYRMFLNQLIAIPHLEFVERVKIIAIPDGREYRMRVWVALK